VGQLSGGIARDFNNQLMIVLGNLETAEQVAKGLSGAALPRVQRALVNAVRGTQRAAALTLPPIFNPKAPKMRLLSMPQRAVSQS